MPQILEAAVTWAAATRNQCRRCLAVMLIVVFSLDGPCEGPICRIHGEGFIEKLVNGRYTSTMVNGRYVADRGTATPSLPGDLVP